MGKFKKFIGESTTFINDKEDMGWLKDVHVKNLPNTAKSAIIYGNEDCPDKVEIFDSEKPHYQDKPIMTLVIDDDGNLKETK
jgi:hypothetical protein